MVKEDSTSYSRKSVFGTAHAAVFRRALNMQPCYSALARMHAHGMAEFIVPTYIYLSHCAGMQVLMKLIIDTLTRVCCSVNNN